VGSRPKGMNACIYIRTRLASQEREEKELRMNVERNLDVNGVLKYHHIILIVEKVSGVTNLLVKK